MDAVTRPGPAFDFFVVSCTLIDEHGRLEIRDPNSPERTAKTWDFDTVLRQCRNLWAYSAA